MALIPIFSVNPTLAQMEAIDSNVVGYWRMDGDTTDETATASTLVESTSKVFASSQVAQGLEGAYIGGNLAALFDRQYWRTSVDSSLQIDGDLTISMVINYMRIHNAPEATQITLVECNNETSGTIEDSSGATNRYSISLRGEGALRMVFSDGAGGQDVFEFTEAIRLTPGVPHHVVVRRSGTTLELYLNNIMVASETLTTATGTATGTTFNVGRQISTANHTVAMSSLCVWDAALTVANISTLYDLHLFDVPSEFSVARVAMGGSVDIDFAAAEVYSKDPNGSAVAFTVSNPLLHRTRSVVVIDTNATPGSLTLPASVTMVIGESIADAGALVQNTQYLLQIYCDDEVTPHYWGSFRAED